MSESPFARSSGSSNGGGKGPQAPAEINPSYPSWPPTWPPQFADSQTPAPAAPAQPAPAPAQSITSQQLTTQSQPLAVGSALVAIRLALGDVAGGRATQAFDKAFASKGFWLTTALTTALLVGFCIANFAWRVSQGAEFIINQIPLVNFSSGYNIGTWLTGIIMAGVFAFALMLIRPATLLGTFAIKGRPQPYSAAATIGAVANLFLIPLLMIVGLLWFVPLDATFILGWIVLIAGLPFCWLLAELLLYIGLARQGRFDSSPLMQHMLLTGVNNVAVVLVSLLGLWIYGSILG